MRKQQKKYKSSFRKISEWLHLWLGLVSGIVVVIVCLTAAIWVFRDEMAYFANPEERIHQENRDFVSPSKTIISLQDYFTQNKLGKPLAISGITYRNPRQTGQVSYQTSDSTYMTAHFNPYTGRILFIKNEEDSRLCKFLLFIRAGHRWLWFPKTSAALL